MTDAEISRLIETSDRLIDDVSTCFHLPRRPAVAEDCDPPATRGDGALAIVSAKCLNGQMQSQIEKSEIENSRLRHGREDMV